MIVSAPTSPAVVSRMQQTASSGPGGSRPAGAGTGSPGKGGAAGAAASTRPGASALPPGGGSGGVPSIICPYGCGQWIPLPELDSHELAHRMATPPGQAAGGGGGAPGQAAEDDWMEAGFGDTDYGDAAFDDSVAAALADEAEARRMQEEADFEALRSKYGFSNKRPGRCFTCGVEGHWSSECPQRGRAAPPPARMSTVPAELAQQQRPDPQGRPGVPRLGALLRGCLESGAGAGYEAYLCCPLQHFGAAAADRGWGCGWRNIQMLSSALLLRSPQLRAALYGGAGFVPDIGSLQAWLESAWAAGFDTMGCESLGGRIQGDRKWIGTTEAAALLRSFGVRAQVVDFEGFGSGSELHPGSMLLADDGSTYHAGVECDLCGANPIRGVRHRSAARPNFDLCSACRAGGSPEAAAAAPYVETGTAATAASGGGARPKRVGQQDAEQQQREQREHLHTPLVDWVWRYFTGQHGPTRHMWEPVAGLSAAHGGGASGAGGGEHGAGGAATAATGAAAQQADGGGGGAGVGAGGASGSDVASMGPERASAVRVTAAAGAGAAAGSGPSSGAGPGPGSGAGPGGGGSSDLRLRSSPVTITGMPPLYFQHEGHSRTIIGIERRRAPRAAAAAGGHITTLLILDPGAPPAALGAALALRRQWQRFVRRGLHTLTRPQYQLMYVDVAGDVAGPGEREGLKVIAAAERYRAPASAAAAAGRGGDRAG
ncbi:hypothetical protein GPECTOR_53g125 [Gonium pectorale]|uniref:CCHC-type domain-containing protein n=1 Tax=Gonium pectorale TaxID=33097 RepID=A0A150G6P6_GONPE|nr:hypothetical protein GPECTOR_53g125 [Gonium pectorale]|eukprot:KXZ45539.1 hypothetical protein GPECTOR_53g125 [Gonium pectorale]